MKIYVKLIGTPTKDYNKVMMVLAERCPIKVNEILQRERSKAETAYKKEYLDGCINLLNEKHPLLWVDNDEPVIPYDEELFNSVNIQTDWKV